MTRVMNLTKIEDTTLWKILSKYEDGDAKLLSTNIVQLCTEASDRMKAMPATAPQYTLHDERHLLRVTELMGIILGQSAEKLNPIELSLLILSAFFHDQGMVITSDEMKKLENDEEYIIFRDNWLINHPNYNEIVKQLNSNIISAEQRESLAEMITELKKAMLTDFIRETHSARSSTYVMLIYESDKRLEIQGVNLSPFLASLCASHTLPDEDIKPNTGFNYDEQIGTYTVNMPFLSSVLRLADILDFDRDRTPEVLLRSIHFTSDISLKSWEKHRSVRGWSISQDKIRFTTECEHPVYEKSIRTYMDWIDIELRNFHRILENQPGSITCYDVKLPSQVDRSRIGPKDDMYRYHDLEFTLSRNEIIRLLMTDKLYGKESLCIRELLQNSMDALRYRKALYKEQDFDWDKGQVEFKHFVNDDGYEVLECKDNGSGMDEDIIRNHFVKVGRSFYRSPFFERERNRLKFSGNDFDPCSQFGIGFMSCFMLGDRISIKTRRDYGSGKNGPPLIIDIYGLGGLLVVREGEDNQPIGTTVIIVSRKKPSYIDSWSDKIQLCKVIQGFALATEFPIIAKCEIPEIKQNLSIPGTYENSPTKLEIAEIKQSILIHKDLTEVTPFIGGYIRESFLIDDKSLPCISNTEAEWSGKIVRKNKEWNLFDPNGKKIDTNDITFGIPVCIDGILIAGNAGRPSYYSEVEGRFGVLNSHIYEKSPSLIDVRGNLKPEMTPGRTPNFKHGIDLPPKWRRVKELFRMGSGLLWEDVINFIPKGLEPEMFWKLLTVYNANPGWIPYDSLWNNCYVSLNKNGNKTKWEKIKNLRDLLMEKTKEGFTLKDKNGWKIGPNSDLSNWESSGSERPNLEKDMNFIVLLMCSIDVVKKEVVLNASQNRGENSPPQQYAVSREIGVSRILLEYRGNAKEAISVETPFPTANRNHPLVNQYYLSRNKSELTDLDDFIGSFIPMITESICSRDNRCSLDKPGRWEKIVGHLYFSVAWDRYDSSLKPPYHIWTKEKDWFEINESDFAIWRDLDIQDE